MSASMNWIAWNSAIGWPNCLALLRVAPARLRRRRARCPTRERRDRDAAAVEDLHRVDEALPSLAEQLLVGDAAVLHDELRRVGGAQSRACSPSCRRGSPAFPCSTTKAEMPCLPCARGRSRANTTATSPTEPCVMKFFEPLSTQPSPSRTAVVFVPPASRAGVGSVRPQAPIHSPGGELRHVAAPLRLGAEQVDVVRAEGVVRGDGEADRGVDARDLLDDRRVVHVAEPRAAVLLGEEHAQEARARRASHDSRGNSCASSHPITCGRISPRQKSRRVWRIA